MARGRSRRRASRPRARPPSSVRKRHEPAAGLDEPWPLLEREVERAEYVKPSRFATPARTICGSGGPVHPARALVALAVLLPLLGCATAGPRFPPEVAISF